MMTIISLIVKSYLAILLSVAAGSLFAFILGLYFIFRKKKIAPREVVSTTNKLEEHDDVAAIAGDDLLATQLDLARAYIETGKIQAAKNILEQVLAQGDVVQQKEAKQLLGFT